MIPYDVTHFCALRLASVWGTARLGPQSGLDELKGCRAHVMRISRDI